MIENIKYYEDDKAKGMIIDWKLVYKEMNRMRIIPKDVYYPKFNFNKNKWNVVCSERSIGKTTNVLILGMTLNKLYGTIIHYIREDEDMLRYGVVKDLFDVILNRHYVEIITDGEWNSITYAKLEKRWYYCNVDETGIITDKAATHFMIDMSIDNNQKYKSSYNCVVGDFIIFDEFISNRYMRNDFIDFCDLFKTIARDRLTPVIVMLANTIDKSSEYFDELEIRDYIDTMEIGQINEVTTERGTNIHVEIYGNEYQHRKKIELNKLFFGFGNPKLGSITGNDWAVSNYQHIKFDNVDILERRVYVKCKSKFIQIDIADTELGIVGLCHMANAPRYEDSYIYSNDDIYDPREHFAFGSGNKLDDYVWRYLYKNNKFYYANNQVGALLDNYIRTTQNL